MQVLAVVILIILFVGCLGDFNFPYNSNHCWKEHEKAKNTKKVTITKADLEEFKDCGLDSYDQLRFFEKVLTRYGIRYESDQVGWTNFYVDERDLEFQKFVDDSNKLISIMTCLSYRLNGSIPDFRESFPELCSYGKSVECNEEAKTYSIKGYCNNLGNPFLGTAHSSYHRILPACYGNHVASMAESKSGCRRRSPREISLAMAEILKTTSNYDNQLLFFGLQMVTHDHAQLQDTTRGGAGFSCCTRDGYMQLDPNLRHPGCVPIELSQNDPFYGAHEHRCQNFMRTNKVLDQCRPDSVNALNNVNTWMDASFNYGNDGEIIWQIVDEFGKFMKNESGIYTFGDGRFNQTPMIHVSQLIYGELHNGLVDLLREANPRCGRKWLFFEARKILIGIYQHILYTEFLPTTLGRENKVAEHYKIFETDNDCYDPSIDPRPTIEFSQSISRLVHQMAPSESCTISSDGEIECFPLSDSFFNLLPWIPDKSTDLLRGMIARSGSLSGLTPELQNLLFKHPKGVGLDLFAIDLHREADNGICSYVDYLKFLGLGCPKSFDDLTKWIETSRVEKLKELFCTVEDIPLGIGATLETKLQGDTLWKPTQSIIFTENFWRHRCGDRFFYTRPDVFTIKQLEQIKGMSMRKVLCTVMKLGRSPKNPFMFVPNFAEWPECEETELNDVFDIGPWTYDGKCPDNAPAYHL